MRSSVTSILDKDPDYWKFLRERPYWHRILSVDRSKIKDFLQEYKIVRRKRFIDKVEDTSNLLAVVSAMMEE
jgi:hypothetical protein